MNLKALGDGARYEHGTELSERVAAGDVRSAGEGKALFSVLSVFSVVQELESTAGNSAA